MERPGSSQEGQDSSKRPTSLAIGSHLDNYLARQQQCLRNCRKKLESTQKESKMLDLQVTEYQMKIQRVKDNISLHAQDTQKLQDDIEDQKEEKSNKSVLLREMNNKWALQPVTLAQ